MMQLEDRLKAVKGVADREKWRARTASFVAKLKATKLVWFPPEPEKAGRATRATAKRTTKKAAAKSNGAAKKTARSAKKVSQPARAKKA